MTGLILVADRHGAAVPGAARLAAALGPDGAAGFATGRGWRLAWGPGTGSARSTGPVHLAFAGRLDNADEVRALLGAEHRPSADVPPEVRFEVGSQAGLAAHDDAALVLAAYRRWDEACWERLLGPFAAIVVDSGRGRVICARDALGDQTVIFRVTPRLLLAATDEELLLDHPQVSRDVDEVTEARFFALLPPERGRTFFRDLRELDPGSAMEAELFGAGSPRFWRHWSPRPRATIRYRRDEEYAEHFRSVLDDAVRARLPSAPGEPAPAVLMSGGLDSTSIAALAGRRLAEQGKRLSTLSWVFDELPRADEREFMEPVVEALGTEAVWIRGDDCWPLGRMAGEGGGTDFESSLVGLGSPYAAIYRRLRDRAYGAVAERGGGVILTGECGDQLFLGGEEWLADLVADRRAWTALVESARGLTRLGGGDRIGLRASLGAVARRWSLARGGSNAVREVARELERPWLTSAARTLIGVDADGGFATPEPRRRHAQEAALADPRIGAAIRREASFARNAGRAAGGRAVEVRRPYRDRRVVELALAFPAHQLYRPGRGKWLTRSAMAGLLPERVLRRGRRSSLYPLFRRGVAERERAMVLALLDSPQARWSRYVRSEWLWGFYSHGVSAEVDGAGALVLWQCLALEIWHRRLAVGEALDSGFLRAGGTGRMTDTMGLTT